MHVEHLWLKDFRSYPSVDLELTSGLCAVLGPNGMGKSNLLEAVGYLALLESFRGAPTDALIRSGSSAAVVRGAVRTDEREQLIEAELVASGRNRIQVNRQRLHRTRDLLGAVRITVFSPDDLALIKVVLDSVGATSTSCWSRSTRATTRCAPSSSELCGSATRC